MHVHKLIGNNGGFCLSKLRWLSSALYLGIPPAQLSSWLPDSSALSSVINRMSGAAPGIPCSLDMSKSVANFNETYLGTMMYHVLIAYKFIIKQMIRV